MARSSAVGTGSVVEATTLILPKANVIIELAKTHRETTKRAKSQTGQFGQAKKDAVEKEHLDGAAFGLAVRLDNLDDERLHVTYVHLMHYLEKLGTLKRALAQEEMFEEHKPPVAAAAVAKGGKTKPAGKEKSAAKPKKGAKANGADNVHHLSEATRKVTEAAGI